MIRIQRTNCCVGDTARPRSGKQELKTGFVEEMVSQCIDAAARFERAAEPREKKARLDGAGLWDAGPEHGVTHVRPPANTVV